MKTILIKVASLAVCLGSYLSAIAQKPLNFDVLSKEWPSVNLEPPLMNDNGSFVAYEKRQFVGGAPKSSELIVKEVYGKWEFTIPGGLSTAIGFTNDGKYFLFRKTADSVGIINLVHKKNIDMSGIGKIDIPRGNYGDKVLFQKITGELVFKSLSESQSKEFGRVKDYQLSDDGSSALLMSSDKNENDKWDWLDLKTEVIIPIVSGASYDNPKWSTDQKGLAFLEKETDVTMLKWFDSNSGTVAVLADDVELARAQQLRIEAIGRVRSSDLAIELQLKSVTEEKVKINDLKAKVTIWSYMDKRLQPIKPMAPSPISIFRKALFLPKSKKIVELTGEVSSVMQPLNGWHVLNNVNKGISVVSALDGGRKDLPPVKKGIVLTHISADARFLIYYDENRKVYLRNKLGSDIFQVIDVGNPKVVWHAIDYLENSYGAIRAASLPKPYIGDLFIVSDQYDIWQMDVSGKKLPVCITNGYGRKNKIVFKIVTDKKGVPVIFKGRTLLSGYGHQNKKEGYFSCDFSKSEDPIPLVFDDFKYSCFVVSVDKKSFLFAREATDSSPNFFLTKDYKAFIEVSNIFPERQFTWFTSEVVDSRLDNGKLVQGTLFKPKNFDVHKKYPVIINY